MASQEALQCYFLVMLDKTRRALNCVDTIELSLHVVLHTSAVKCTLKANSAKGYEHTVFDNAAFSSMELIPCI